MCLWIFALWISATRAAENFAFAPPVSQFPGIDPALVVAASFAPPAPISNPPFNALSPPAESSSSEAFAQPPSKENEVLTYPVSFSPPQPFFPSFEGSSLDPQPVDLAPPSSALFAPPSFHTSPSNAPSAPYPPALSFAPNGPPTSFAPSPSNAPYAPPSPSNAPYSPPPPINSGISPPMPIKRIPFVPSFSVPHAPPSYTNFAPAIPAISYGPPGYAPPSLAPPPPPSPPLPPPIPSPPTRPATTYGLSTHGVFDQQDELDQKNFRFFRLQKETNGLDDDYSRW